MSDVSLCVRVCLCVCACDRDREREREGGQRLELDQTLCEGSRVSCAGPESSPGGRKPGAKAGSGTRASAPRKVGVRPQVRRGRPLLSPCSVPESKLMEGSKGKGKIPHIFLEPGVQPRH